MSHGITMAVTLYIAYRGGEWLDKRFGTSPWLMVVTVLLVVAANLRMLVKDVMQQMDDRQDPNS